MFASFDYDCNIKALLRGCRVKDFVFLGIIALSYLIRLEPYTTIFLHQNDQMDDPNRIFSDFQESNAALSIIAWLKVLSSTQ